MARRQRPPFEAAVSDSPFFRLPLELRTMIYELLLVQEGGMSIPSDIFGCSKARREGRRPIECGNCGALFSNRASHEQHGKHTRGDWWHFDFEYAVPRIHPNFPEVCTSILLTCRLIHHEAISILYTKNNFRFSDPTTAGNFRSSADHTLAGSVQGICINLTDAFPGDDDSWWAYATNVSSGLKQDFRNLKRMIIDVSVKFERAFAIRVELSLKTLAQYVCGLDWLHVTGVSNEKVLEYLEPMVKKDGDQGNSQKQVQKHVTDFDFTEFYEVGPYTIQPFFDKTRLMIFEECYTLVGTFRRQGTLDRQRGYGYTKQAISIPARGQRIGKFIYG